MTCQIVRTSLALFLFSVLSHQACADTSKSPEPYEDRSLVKPHTELKTEIVEAALPSTLACFVTPKGAGVEGELIGKISMSNGAPVCSYKLPPESANTEDSTEFNWLSASFYEQTGWLEIHAHKEIDLRSHTYYYAMRNKDHTVPSPCAIRDKNMLKWGYETITNDQKRSCAHLTGAEYYSNYQPACLPSVAELKEPGSEGDNNLSSRPSSCSENAFTTACHNCSWDGCKFFTCSSFTIYDKCPEGSHECGSETCVGGLCSHRPWCDYDKTSHSHDEP